jgi:uncharacterized protein
MIHKFTMFETNIVVDVNSGAVHEVDDAAMAVIDLYLQEEYSTIVDKFGPQFGNEEIEDAYNEIKSLEQGGLLFTEDTFESNPKLRNDNSIIKAMCLHVSHDCNLRCGYCFAATGNFGGERLLMSAEVGRKSIDFLLKNSDGRKNLEIDFFGGEPLMNFGVVKEIVEYALSKEKEYNKKFNFTLTTNGVLLNDENIKYMNEHMQNLVLSIDGRKKTNDSMRTRLDGSGSYDRILPLLKKVAESRNQDKYYVRGTFTANNIDFSEDVMHLADQGFKQISIEPVVAAKGTEYELMEEHLPGLFKEYEKLAMEYSKRNKGDEWFNFFHFMLDLSGGPCIAKRLSGCGAGHEYVAVTPEGDIYPCHQFVGIDNMKLGNIYKEGLDESIQKIFKSSNVYTKPECTSCWAKFYCSGGCAANSYQFNSNINSAYKIGCELEKKRVECALWIKTDDKNGSI